ncbi:MAG: 4-hydroxy-tetrahydrodipicolinate synthase [Bacteroidales bacterium]
MTINKFRGTGVALVTPFRANGSIDFPALKRVVEHIVSGGADFLVALGTTAETPTLSSDEKKSVVETILEVNGGRLPVVLGVGGNDTAALLRQLSVLPDAGIDAILSVAPYYNKPNQAGLFRHFEAVAGQSPLPVIIYNVPSRTGSNISAETTLKLAFEFPNIIATKEASGNFDQISAILKGRPEGFLVLSGDDSLTLPLMSLGVDGVISVIANLLPEKMSRMVALMNQHDLAGARRLHFELLDLMNLIFKEGSPAGIKSALRCQGLAEPWVRLPLVSVSDQLDQEIRSALELV